MKFDERGQAVWEWAVKTGMFDRNASTQRIKALVEAPLDLQIDDATPQGAKPGAASPAGGELYERATPRSGLPTREKARRPVEPSVEWQPGPVTKAITPPDAGGFDPYSRGPAKRPEDVSFNPYERGAPRKR